MQAREAEKPSNATKTVAKDDSASDQVESSNAGDKDKEEWVDVEKTDEKVDADVEKMRQEEAEYIKTLRFNVNVFLPYMKSIESIDKDAYEQLQKDEEEARKLASYLWNTVIPNVTKNIRLDSCKTVQIPTDGQSLTEFLHARGINCRYLGRLADLARIEEQKDIDAEKAYENNKKENKLPRFRMPLCWLELLECEMVARAAKHVLDSYLTENGGTAAAQPAQTIASLLSAVVSNGEEASSETELRTAVGGEDVINADEINALTLFGVGGCGDAVHKPVRGRIEIWSDIEKEIGRRYRYTLSLYNKGKHNSRALYPSLLRRICQRSGIRIVAKSYDIGKKCVCGGGSNSAGRLDYSYPIAAVDILDVLPMVKHAASSGEEDSFFPCRFDSTNTSSLHIVFSDAKALSEGAIRHLNAGNVGHALEFAQEAAHLYQRVVDSPLHVQVAKNIHLMSKCQIVGQDNEAAIQSTLKYLAVAVSIGGFDCKEALDAHNQLSDLYFAVGQVKEAIKHIRALSYLMEFSAGGNFSQLSAIYYKLGIQYYEGSKLSDALTFYDVAQKKRSDDRFVDSIIASSSALALGRLGKFSDASTQEKIAYQLNLALLGEEHDRTKMSSSSLLVSISCLLRLAGVIELSNTLGCLYLHQQFMRLAMEQGRVAAAQKNKHTREIEANAIAESIKAEEDRAESAAKKKKKKKKGSKSGNTSENENSPENVAQKNVSKAA
jgi:protein TIF31